jgi:hypothetical protein
MGQPQFSLQISIHQKSSILREIHSLSVHGVLFVCIFFQCNVPTAIHTALKRYSVPNATQNPLGTTMCSMIRASLSADYDTLILSAEIIFVIDCSKTARLWKIWMRTPISWRVCSESYRISTSHRNLKIRFGPICKASARRLKRSWLAMRLSGLMGCITCNMFSLGAITINKNTFIAAVSQRS